MLVYPVSLKRNLYRGKDAKKSAKAQLENRRITKIEGYINERLREKSEPTKIYMYSQIANATGQPIALVRRLFSEMGGGDNGVTFTKPA